MRVIFLARLSCLKLSKIRYPFWLERADSWPPLVGNAVARLERQPKIAKLMAALEKSMTGDEGLGR